MIENAENKAEVSDRIKNHVVIENYFLNNYSTVSSSFLNLMEQNGIVFFEVFFDDKTFFKEHIRVYQNEGNSKLADKNNEIQQENLFEKHEPDRIMLPEYFKEYGYKTNDKIEIGITPKKCVLDIESDYIKNNYSKEYIDHLFVNIFDMACEITANENGEEAIKSFVTGNCVSHTYTIDGFYNESKSDDFSIGSNGKNFSFIVTSDSYDIVYETFKNNTEKLSEGISYSSQYDMYATINDNVDFQEGIYTLLEDCGYSRSSYYNLFNEESFNSELLILKGKLAFSAVSYAPLVLILIILLMIIWLLLRFIVDNAFEISAHERTSQFTLLRIIGTSHNQMKAFILCEALFYILLAIPAGIILALAISKCVIYFIKKSGIEFIEYSKHPVIILIGIVLCIISVLISSHTSAFWKARKKSLVNSQTAHYKLKKHRFRSVKRKNKRKKTNLKSAAFILKYTYKNISRTRDRFIISVAAMCIGVTAFSLLFSTVLSFRKLYTENIFSIHDFNISVEYIQRENLKEIDKIYEKFNKNESVEKLSFDFYFEAETGSDMIATDFYELNKDRNYIHAHVVNENNYISSYQKETKISYEQLVKSDEMLMITTEDNSTLNFEDNKISYVNNLKIADVMNHEYDSKCMIIVITYDTFKKMMSDFNNLSDVFLTNLSIGIKVNDNLKHSEANAEVKRLAEEMKQVYLMEDMYFCCTGLKSFMTGISILIGMFVGAMWLSGIITMSNSINTSVLNRKEEFISMRAIGMTKKKLFALVHVESSIFVLTSFVIGILISVAFYFTIFSGFPRKYIIISAITVLVLNIVFASIATIPAIRTVKDKIKVNSVE